MYSVTCQLHIKEENMILPKTKPSNFCSQNTEII